MEEQEDEIMARSVLLDTEATFRLVNKLMGVLTGFALIAVAMSFGMYYVKQEDVIRVFISTTLGWAGYLFAHYSATGKFIHQGKHQHTLPSDWKKILGGTYGILQITAGIAIWVIALSQEDLLTMILGSFVALLGYLIAHQEFTGDVL